VGFFLSSTNTSGSGILRERRRVSGLRAGQQLSLSAIALTGCPASVSAGTYFLSAVADLDDAVVETTRRTTGSRTAAQIDVFRPDLDIVPLVTAPRCGRPVQAVHGDRARAQPGTAAGGGPAPSAWARTCRRCPILGTGILVGSVAVTSLNPQTNASVTIPVAVPAFIAPGSYFVSVRGG
jgi:hypothetical protein